MPGSGQVEKAFRRYRTHLECPDCNVHVETCYKKYERRT